MSFNLFSTSLGEMEESNSTLYQRCKPERRVRSSNLFAGKRRLRVTAPTSFRKPSNRLIPDRVGADWLRALCSVFSTCSVTSSRNFTSTTFGNASEEAFTITGPLLSVLDSGVTYTVLSSIHAARNNRLHAAIAILCFIKQLRI